MERLTKKEEKLLIKAVTFFVNYKFEIPRSSLKSYVELTQKEDEYEDYYNLCKKLGGKPRW